MKPNFDVFGLAKLLWAMISGKPRFPLEDFDIAPHDLRGMFPDNPNVLYVHRIFRKAIVRREEECQLADGSALLADIDEAILALESGGQLPRQDSNLRCRFCGIGTYSSISDDGEIARSNPNLLGIIYLSDGAPSVAASWDFQSVES